MRVHILRSLLLIALKRGDEAVIRLESVAFVQDQDTTSPGETASIYSKISTKISTFHSGLPNTEPDVNSLAVYKSDDSVALAELARTEISQATVRRILSGINYLSKKTTKLVSYDLLYNKFPEFIDSDDMQHRNDYWLFGLMFEFLRHTSAISSVDLDSILNIIESQCEVISKLSVMQVSELVHRQLVEAGARMRSALADVKAHTPTEPVAKRLKWTLDESSESMPQSQIVDKKAEGSSGGESLIDSASSQPTSQPAVALLSNLTVNSENPNGNAIAGHAVVNREGIPVALGTGRGANNYYCGRNLGVAAIPGSDGRCGPNNGPQCRSCAGYTASNPPPSAPAVSVDIPFPILSQGMMSAVASIAGAEVCGGAMRKRLIRILRPLSLYDANWTGILKELSLIGSHLAGSAVTELSDVFAMLKDVVARGKDASYAMSQSQLSTPSSVSELRLLQVLLYSLCSVLLNVLLNNTLH